LALCSCGTERLTSRNFCQTFSLCAKKVAYCITKPEAGTDVSGIKAAATPDGDGWLLNGGKI
jgi:alkylation response protein AidB-like acyl-CoA dehydrogenase